MTEPYEQHFPPGGKEEFPPPRIPPPKPAPKME